MMQNTDYRTGFEKLADQCREKNIALQAIKTIAQGPKKNTEDTTFATWYEPLCKPEEIETAVHWALSNEQIFLNTAGDIHLLPHILEAASQFETKVDDSEMENLVKAKGMAPLFS